MIRSIVLYGDSVLREKCPEVTQITPEIEKLATDMIDTMKAAHGVGLAAPQIGERIRLAVIDVSHDIDCVTYVRLDGEEKTLADVMPLIFVNPVVKGGKAKERDKEGCLSFPYLQFQVNRSEGVMMEYMGLDGAPHTIETDGLLARAIQHETDHVNGILFIDRISSAARLSLRKKIRDLQEEWNALGEHPMGSGEAVS